MTKPKIVSINISKEKGTIKQSVPVAEVNKLGLKDDAHAGYWHRQVTLLASERITFFSQQANRKINYGEFAENISTEGIDLSTVKVLDRFTFGDVELEVTQLGKKCHGTSCAIYREVGNCIMPVEGIFCRVIKTGNIKIGMEFEHHQKAVKIVVITLSDRANAGIYEDKSGLEVQNLIAKHFEKSHFNIEIEYFLIPDDENVLKDLLINLTKSNVDAIFTTGGTGIGPKDITPDVVKSLLDKEIPGIMEMIRITYGKEKPAVLVSRSIAGVIKNSLIFTLPGSVKAVQEYLFEINKSIFHLLYMKYGIDNH